MRSIHTVPALLTLLMVAAAEPPAHADPPSAETDHRPERGSDNALSTTPAIACRSIDGYEKYEVLPDASITAEEKLLVYYRPLNYHIEKTGKGYHVHLTQDGQIRRRGEKTVLMRKEKLLEYEFTVDYAPNPVFLRNTVALKGLKPGDYEFDIILHDKLAKDATFTRSLPFKIVPVVLPRAETEAEAAPEPPAPAPAPKARVKAKRKRAQPTRGASSTKP